MGNTNYSDYRLCMRFIRRLIIDPNYNLTKCIKPSYGVYSNKQE